MKKAILGFVLLILAIVIYSFLADFSGEFIESIKRLVGYNVPEITGPPIARPDIDDDQDGLGFLNVPEGFRISVAAKGLTNPRVIVFDSKNRMLVSETKAGRVMILEALSFAKALEGAAKNSEFKNKRVLIDGLNSPHGLAFFVEGETTYLYIAETHQVARYAYDDNVGKIIEEVGANIATLPKDGGHFTRTIMFGPNWRDRDLVKGTFPIGGFYSNDKLYISVGSSCNVCMENTWKRAAILESDPQGTFTGEFAGGLRNSVFFTFHPDTHEIWATDMGRDELGDNLPPDEVNIVKVAGPEHKFGARRFGWPFCYGNKIKDATFNPEKVERTDIPTDCSQTDAPVIEIPAHSAPLGLAFIPSTNRWPSQWKNDLLVAYHGSWNRSEPTGYKIVRFKVDKNGKVSETSDFITGWLALSKSNGLSSNKKKIYGRPVDLKFGPDGALYISDDAGGVIYKLEPK